MQTVIYIGICSVLLGVDNGNIIIVLVFWTTVIAML